MLNNFRTFQISVKFYKEAIKIKLPRHLKDQLNRSSSSISLNLAEGHGKSTFTGCEYVEHAAKKVFLHSNGQSERISGSINII